VIRRGFYLSLCSKGIFGGRENDRGKDKKTGGGGVANVMLAVPTRNHQRKEGEGKKTGYWQAGKPFKEHIPGGTGKKKVRKKAGGGSNIRPA